MIRCSSCGCERFKSSNSKQLLNERLFGNVIKTNVFGRRISKKQQKREILIENRAKGKAAEDLFVMQEVLAGN